MQKKGCEAYKQYVCIQVGFGTFGVSNKGRCPICAKKAEKVTNVAFVGCTYKIKSLRLIAGQYGHYRPQKNLLHEGETTAGKYTTFDQGANCEWQDLEIKTKPPIIKLQVHWGDRYFYLIAHPEYRGSDLIEQIEKEIGKDSKIKAFFNLKRLDKGLTLREQSLHTGDTITVILREWVKLSGPSFAFSALSFNNLSFGFFRSFGSRESSRGSINRKQVNIRKYGPACDFRSPRL